MAWHEAFQTPARLHGLVLCDNQQTRQGEHWLGEVWGMLWQAGAERGTDAKGRTPTQPKAEPTPRGRRARGVVDVH